ncbi:OstA-like protein [Chitinophaga sp. YIM B06452]|uniref:OstA-like protein n=1 Tax=Chitinophaga sp. YIM B06452 TaxID=3082158 RepID=UPI0031FF06BD
MFKNALYGLILLGGIGASGLLTAAYRAPARLPLNRPETVPVQEDTSKKIQLIQAKSVVNLQTDTLNERRFVGDVIFKQGTSLLSCDSASFNANTNIIEAWGHVHINQDDSVHTYSDQLLYRGNQRLATLTGNAKLTDTKIVLTSPTLNYDLNTKIGTYDQGGRLVNGESVLTSREGVYYGETKDVYFKKEVVVVDPGFTLGTDTLMYNSVTKIATIMAPTTINDGKMTMYVTSGYYNTELGYGNFAERPTIEDSTNTFTANEIQTDKATGISIATGNMIWRDTAQKVAVLANYGIVNQNVKTVLATQKPVMLLEGKDDTLFVAGDTLFSGIIPILKDSAALAEDSARIARGDTSNASKSDTAEKRFLIAYHHVKIYSDSLQGVADSVYYSSVDSVFRLYRDPVLWASNNQLTGDTIFLFTKNQKADKLLLDQNALIVNSPGPEMYNQIKGNTILGYFGDERLDSMYVNGNAENIYYVQDDDSAFVSINRLLSANTRVYFEKGELERIVFVKEPEATMYPFTQMPEEQKLLPGFKWEIHRKPKSKYELIGQ